MKRASELDPPPAKRVAVESQDGIAVASAARSVDSFIGNTANLDGEVLECDDIVMHVQEDTIEGETNLSDFSENEDNSKSMGKLETAHVNDDSKEQETDEEPVFEAEAKPAPVIEAGAKTETAIETETKSKPSLGTASKEKSPKAKSKKTKAKAKKVKKKTKKVPSPPKKKGSKKSDKDKDKKNAFGHGKGGPKKDGVFSGVTNCLACNENYGDENKLRNHIKKKHSREPMTNCTICGRDFASEISCRQHRKHIHHKGMWQCRHCNLAFAKYVDCLNHEFVHEIKSKKKRDKLLALLPGTPILQAENSKRVKPRNSIIIKEDTSSEEELSSDDSSEESSEEDSEDCSNASESSIESIDLSCLIIPAETPRGTACMRCLRTDDDDAFLLCDHDGEILHGGHFYCFGMKRVPKGDWFCPIHNMSKAVDKFMKGKKKASKKKTSQKKSKSEEKKQSKSTAKDAGESEKSFMCFFCEKRFSTSGYLKRHMNRFHSDQKRVSDVSEDSPKLKKQKKKKKKKGDKVKRTSKTPKTSSKKKSNKNKPKIIRSIPRNKPSARAEMFARLQEAHENESSENSDDDIGEDGMTARDRAHSDHVKRILEEERLKKERAMEQEKNAAEELKHQLQMIEKHLQQSQPPMPPQPPPLPSIAFQVPPPTIPLPQTPPQFGTSNQPPRIFSQPIVSPAVIDKQQKPQWGFRPKKPALPPPQNFQLPGSKPPTPHMWTSAPPPQHQSTWQVVPGSVPKPPPPSNVKSDPKKPLDSWKSPPHSAPYEYRWVEPKKNNQPNGWTVAEPTPLKNPPIIMRQSIGSDYKDFNYRRNNRGKDFYDRREPGYRRRSRSPKRRNRDRGRGRDRDRRKYSNPPARHHNSSREYTRRNDRRDSNNSTQWSGFKRYENGQMKSSASTMNSNYRSRNFSDRRRIPGVTRRPIFTEKPGRPPRPPSTIPANPKKSDFRDKQLYKVKDDGGVEIL